MARVAEKRKLRITTWLIVCTIVGTTLLSLWAYSGSRPRWNLYSTNTTAWGVALERGRLMLCHWWIDGDMDWLRLAERDARKTRNIVEIEGMDDLLYKSLLDKKVSPSDYKIKHVQLPYRPTTVADQAEYRFEVFLGNLPAPAPHLRFRSESWPKDPEFYAGWTLTYHYAILPLWALPWLFFAWPVAFVVRRVLKRSRRTV